MNSLMANLLAMLAGFSAALYFIKSAEKKDLTYLASGLSRTYLAGILFIIANFNDSFQLGMQDSLVALAAVIISDIGVGLVYRFSRKYVLDIEYSKTINRLKELSEKFSVIIESAITGFFTIDQQGNIEFTNQSLADILEYSRGELVGKNLFAFLEDTCIRDIFCQDKFNCASTKVKTRTGRIISVHISGGKTRNGHETITGSIIELE